MSLRIVFFYLWFTKAPLVEGRGDTQLLELPWASQRFIHFLITKHNEPFT